MPTSNLISSADTTFCLSDKTKYTALGNTTVQYRKTDYITPYSGNGPYSPGQKIIFSIPPDKGFVDFSSMWFEFKINRTPPGGEPAGTRWAYKTDASSIIRDLKIKIGGQTIVDYPDYNIWYSYLNGNTTPRGFYATQQNLLNGAIDLTPYDGQWDGAQVKRTAANWLEYPPQVPFSNTDNRFTEHVKLAVGFLSILKFFPAHLLREFKIELTVNTANNTIYSYDSTSSTNQNGGANSGTIVVTNPRLFFDTVAMDPAFEENVRELAKADSLMIPFIQLDRYIESDTANYAAGSTFTHRLTPKVGSLKSIYVFPVPTFSSNSDAAGNSQELYRWKSTSYEQSLSSYNFKIAGEYFPIQPVTSAQTRAYNVLKALGLWNNTTGAGSLTAKTLGLNYRWSSDGGLYNDIPARRVFAGMSYDFDREDCPDLLSGFNSDSVKVPIEFTYTIASPGTSTVDIAVNMWVLYNATLRILNTGEVDVIR